MFPGWRVRIACLTVGEVQHIPPTEFESFEATYEGDSCLLGEPTAVARVKLFGKEYKISVRAGTHPDGQMDGVYVERVQ